MERLVTWLWQGTVLAVGVWGLLRIWRPNAATRFAIWWATLAAVAMLLVAPPLFARLSSMSMSVSAQPAGAIGIIARDAAVGDAAAPGAAALATASDAADPLLPFTLPMVPAPFIALGIGAWLGFSLLGLVHLAVSVGHLRRIKRACRPFPHEREHRLTRWLMVRREGRRVRLCVSDDVRSASALGLGVGPAIIAINSALINDVDDEELDHIILHEYAHIRRRDDWLHVLQLAVQALLVLHPAVSWIGRALRLEREAACDEWVVERTQMPTAYAHCLTKVAAFELSGANELIAAMGIVGRRGELTRRIERLLAPRRARHTRLAPMPVASVAMMLAAATVGLWQLPPLVAIERAIEAEAAAGADAAAAGATAVASPTRSAAAAPASEASAADVLTRPSAITIVREQPSSLSSSSPASASSSASSSSSSWPRADMTNARRVPTIQLAALEAPHAAHVAPAASASSPMAARNVAVTAASLVAMMPATGGFHLPASAGARADAHGGTANARGDAANAHGDASANAGEAEAEAVNAETAGAAATEDLDGVASTSRRVWERVASAGAAVGQRTADVSQSTAKNLAARPSVRGTLTAGAAVGQAGASVGQGVGKGARRAGTATGSFFARVGSSLSKVLP